MSVRQAARHALGLTHPAEKVQAVQALWHSADYATAPQEQAATIAAHCHLPSNGRPAKPELVHPKDVPQRGMKNLEGRAALLHAVVHIEFNAINLALDAVWRFDQMPTQFYADWMRVAYEESQHFQMLEQHLNHMGWQYGDFIAHDGLWTMCEKTQHDIVARMALVPRTLEARGLDATPYIQQRLRNVHAADAETTATLLETILRDEIGHVAIGNHWYHWLCQQQGFEPVAHYRHLVDVYAPPRLKPPFNEAARKEAGFTQAELDYLLYNGPT